MTDADRLYRARRDQAAQLAREQAATKAAAAENERNKALRAINELVPQVLAALAEKGYPGGRLIRVKKTFGSTERAAWQVASRQDWNRDGYVSATCYLLSTGDFADKNHWTPLSGSTPCRASEVNYEAQAIEAGLRALLEEYGR